MDLANDTSRMEQFDRCSDRELLDGISSDLKARRRLEVDELCRIVTWADRHVVDTIEGAATITEGFLDTGIPIAGPGAPLVSEFGLMELIATLERSPDGGRDYVGKVLECCWRLPGIWAAILAERCPVFKALRVAELTRPLSAQAAAFVDQQLAFAVGTCTWAQIERLVDEAIIRYDPAEAERRRQESTDQRHFDIHLDQAVDGLVPTEGLLDAADAADLEQAITRRAKALALFESQDSLDVRRSIAAGELARNDLTLDLEISDPDTGQSKTVPGRKVELHLHLAETAVLSSTLDPDTAVGRWGDQRSPISAEQIRQWCGLPGGSIIVRPVIDLAGHVPVDSYEIPDRLKTQVRLRDHHCAHPYCSRPAERCDLDHVRPYAQGGVTCPCSLIPQCRRHHRAKTHGEWNIIVIDPGAYLWISPNGRHWLVDHRGTRALDPPRRLDPQTMDVEHPWETQGHSEVVPPCPKAEHLASERAARPTRSTRTGDQLDLSTDPPPE